MNEKLLFNIEHDINNETDYELSDYNKKVANEYILKLNNIVDILKKEDMIPNNVNFDINNIVYKIESEEESELKTYLHYNSLTPTGKMPKNKCRLYFLLLNESDENLKDGILYEKELNIYTKDRIDGYIKISHEDVVTGVKIDFNIGKIMYRIETNSLYVSNKDEITYWTANSSANGNPFKFEIDLEKILKEVKDELDIE